MSTPHTPAEDILAEFEVELDPANRNRRFINFLVDRFVFYFFYKGFVWLWIYISVPIYFEDYYTRYIFNIMLGLLVYALFMGITEALFRGKTLGKLFTGTRAVTADGRNIPIKTALLRGLSRAVPFEFFSAFGGQWPNPWHDKWTNTYVVVERTSTLRL